MMIYLEEKNSEPEMTNIHSERAYVYVCVYNRLTKGIDLSSKVSKFVKEKSQVK